MKNIAIRIIVLTMALFSIIGVLCFSGCAKKEPPGPIENLTLEVGEDSDLFFVKAAWEPVDGAVGYYLVARSDSDTLEHCVITPETETVFSNLEYGESYTVTATSFINDWRKNKIFSDSVSAEIIVVSVIEVDDNT